jgi:hypothetical protein
LITISIPLSQPSLRRAISIKPTFQMNFRAFTLSEGMIPKATFFPQVTKAYLNFCKKLSASQRSRRLNPYMHLHRCGGPVIEADDPQDNAILDGFDPPELPRIYNVPRVLLI